MCESDAMASHGLSFCTVNHIVLKDVFLRILLFSILSLVQTLKCVIYLFQVEVSSPNADTENPLCMNQATNSSTTATSETPADSELPAPAHAAISNNCTNESGRKLNHRILSYRVVSFPEVTTNIRSGLSSFSVINDAQSSNQFILFFHKIDYNKFSLR